MRNKRKQNHWFTLVEIIVSLTILSIIMVSFITIYISSADVALKTDINRMMQENIKNAVSHITEDVIKNGIIWVSEGKTDACALPSWSDTYIWWDQLCTLWNSYYLAKKAIWWWIRIWDISECENIDDHCVIYKGNQPLTNSSVSIRDLQFFVSKENVAKVTIKIVMQPARWRGVKDYLIKGNKLIFQTTISERPF